MRAIILDESLSVSKRARQVLSDFEPETRVAFADSPAVLKSILAVSRPDDLLIVNVHGDLSAWAVAEQIRRLRFEGQILALVDDLGQPGSQHLLALPRTECVVRPASAEGIDHLLGEAMANAKPPAQCRLAPEDTVVDSFNGIVGRSKAMQEIFSRIEKVATSDASVCIYGESGTGKELIARAIHAASLRRERPFVALDCTAIPEGLMESQLFGHVRGAFTGAVQNREGVFSLAHTGTLFMDELCELDLALQAKLLRVVQTREFVPVGGTKPIRSNVRLITATNKDPKLEVERGTFREDLYYRVAVVMIKLPPLRERKEDIPLLVEHFTRKFSLAHNKVILGIEPSVMDRLVNASWPGNVRQLENFVEQAIVLAESEVLNESDSFDEEISAEPARSESGSVSDIQPGLTLREVERRYIVRTLQDADGNRTVAARRLGISVRCLHYKLKSYAQDSDIILPSTALREGMNLNTRVTAWTQQP